MELSTRKENILASIVRSYIRTGDPVGSKALCEELGSVSSATIRNEMSELSEMGFLDQPHTSAGRVPTEQAFRFYIDRLMKRRDLTEQEKLAIESLIPVGDGDLEHALHRASAALSRATRCVSIVTSEADRGTLIHKVELIPLSRHSALIVLVTSTGVVKNRLFRFPEQLSSELISRFFRLVQDELVGTDIAAWHPAAIQTVAAKGGVELSELLSAVGELISECAESRLELSGQSNLLSFDGFSAHRARQFFDLFARRDEVISMLDMWNRDAGVIFGADTSYSALEQSSLVVSRYRIGNAQTGYVGLIGPLRMDYELLLPSIKYFADKLNDSFPKDTVKG